jgi:hypothetical protein
MEFCASAKLVKTELDSTTVERKKFRCLGKTNTPGLPNTISLGNYLRFPMVHSTTPNGQRITSYGYQRIFGLLNRGNLSRLDLPAQIRILEKKIAMTSPETLYTKVAAKELSFLLVTHTTYSDARFDSYGILKSG